MDKPLANLLDPATLLGWGQTVGLKVVAGVATFFVGRWIAGQLVRLLERGMKRAGVEPTLASFLGNVSYGLMLAVVVISALGQLGVNTTSAAALMGGAGVAVGLSLKDQLSAFASGAMLIVFRPFKVGDFIDAGGTTGTVEEIRIVATVMRTPNNQQVTVPNDKIWGSTITNYNAKLTRRIDLPVGISYDADMKKAKTIVGEIIAADERILGDPVPWIGITDLGDSAVVMTVRPWVKTADYWQVRADLIEEIKTRFDAQDIGIPYPQMDVHMHSS